MGVEGGDDLRFGFRADLLTALKSGDGIWRDPRLSGVSTNETDLGFQLTEGFGLIAVT
jgi:hypothetical protein